jgi:hypothetical protein
MEQLLTRGFMVLIPILVSSSAVAGRAAVVLNLDEIQITPEVLRTLDGLGTSVPEKYVAEEVARMAAVCKSRYFTHYAAPVLLVRHFKGPSLELVLLRTVNDKGDRFLVCFSDWPSDDKAFNFYRETAEGSMFLGSVSGDEILVAKNGFAYVSGHVNNYVDETKIVKLTHDKAVEVPSEIRYVGVSTSTKHPVVLYTSSDQGSREAIATLPQGESVHLLVKQADTDSERAEVCLFVKTAGGMVGWICVEESKLDDHSSPLESVFFRGD